ncbi:unnamed protein product [Nezara viridula]|uniref:Uncharacterized protein n=1 Tax=Nezara viridula TaxID=85310 RepID=A0A9P0HRK7_NEZVI|nr:unnamed protein product [Nezara viridula]
MPENRMARIALREKDLRESSRRPVSSVSRRPFTEGILTGGGGGRWLRIESCVFGSTRRLLTPLRARRGND